MKVCKNMLKTFRKINKLRFTSSITSSSSFTNDVLNKLALNVVNNLDSFNDVNNVEHKKNRDH